MSVKSSALNVERSAAVDAENPWPGLASFTEDSRAFFFGREKETEELVRLIRRNTLTVLFGQSGLGKSSLLQAGAFPVLREADYLPLYLRLDHAVDAADVARVSRPVGSDNTGQETRATLADQVKAALVDAFKSVGADAPAPRADETLWEYFHRKDVDIWSAKNRLLTPVLAFDQFEEIFTLGRASEAQRERGRAFLTELADLVENRAPAALRAKFDSGELDISRYNFDKPSCQVVLSLREDYLPDLEGLKHEMRSILHSRMRVRRLNGAQALEIVQRPAPHLIAEGVGEKIVEFVAGARGGSAERLAELEVEPALLSVICRELNERRRTLGQTQITADLVSGNRREILTDFYERSVADLPDDMRAFVEDHLLTKSGFRDNLALETALDFPGVTRPLIDTLVNRRLLRIEDRLGVERVELTHDVLAEVIRGSRDTRQQRIAVEQAHQKERVTRRRMWLARIIAAGLLVGLTGVSWIAWRAIRAERAADTARAREATLRTEAEAQKMSARRAAYAADMNGVQYSLAMDNLGRARELLQRHRPAPGDMDLRGWEWRYLWQFSQSDAQAVLLAAGPYSADSLSTSADGKWLAAGIGPQAVLMNRETGELIRLPTGPFCRVVFSPTEMLCAISFSERDGATGELRPQIAWWNAISQRIERKSPLGEGREGSRHNFVFSADGQHLAMIAPNYRTRQMELSVWRVSDGSKVAGWAAGEIPNISATENLAVTPDFALAAVLSGSNHVKLFDLKTGQNLWSKAVSEQVASSVAISPDGTVLATGGGYTDPTIRLWELATGRELGRLEGHRSNVGCLKFSRDGQRLISSSGDQTIRIWNLTERTAIRAFRGHDSEVWRLTLLPDGKSLVSGGKDGSVLLWDLDAERAADARGSLPRRFMAWTFGGQGESLVTVDLAGNVARSHGRMFQESAPVLELGPIANALFDRRQPRLAVTTPEAKVQVWDWDRRTLLREIPAIRESETTVPQGFSGDGSRLVVRYSSGGQSSFREWEIVTGRETWTLRSVSGLGFLSANSAYAHDGKRPLVFKRTGGRSLEVFRPENPTEPIELKVPQPREPRFSPDGRILAFPDVFGSVRLFHGDTLKELATLTGFMHGVHSVNFSPDGQRLVTGGTAMEAVTIWDVAGRERLLTLPALEDQLVPTAFSPDGKVLIGESGLGATSGTLHFWRAPTWEEIARAEAAEGAARKPPTP